MMFARALLCIALFTAPLLPAEDVGFMVRFGFKDTTPTPWDGSLSVSTGQVSGLEGWRFEAQDKVTGPTEWKASTRALTQRKARGNNPGKLGQRQQQANVPMADNGVIAYLSGVSADTQVSVKTARGEFAFKVAEVVVGKGIPQLDGRVLVERVAFTTRVTPDDNQDDDFPSVAVAKDGTTWLAYTSFTPGLDRVGRAKGLDKQPDSFDDLAKPTGGDRLWLVSRSPGQEKWSQPHPITEAGRDLLGCSVAVDFKGRPWVSYAERQEDGSFLAKTARFHSDAQGGMMEMGSGSTKGESNMMKPVSVTAASGEIWSAWVQKEGNWLCIKGQRNWENPKAGGSSAISVSASMVEYNCWSPAIAASADGRVAVAWDAYEHGDYDVYVREFDKDGKEGDIRVVANTPGYETRPALTYDAQGRLWIAWEQSGPKWGKDWGAYDREDGIGLYKSRTIGLRVLENGVWKEPVEMPEAALPGKMGRGGWAGLSWSQPDGATPKNAPTGFAADENKPNRVNEGQSAPQAGGKGKGQGKSKGKGKMAQGGAKGQKEREKGEEAEVTAQQIFNNLARICADQQGRIWLLCRTKQGQFHTPLGSVWMDYAACYDGAKWHGPILIPHTDNLGFNQPSVAALPNGIRIAHSTDHRQDKLTVYLQNRLAAGKGGNASLNASVDPFVNDIYVSDLTLEGKMDTMSLRDAATKPMEGKTPAPYATKELADVKAVRDYRTEVNGTRLQILRGEFHRHTEISGDGGGDGPLEDMWRYALDVASFDWIGNGDHDNGGGREYTWWLTQKSTDAYHMPGRFDPLFSYERSVSYPEGHRNVIFTQRGIRTLPRLPISDAFEFKPAPDTEMLYKYLHHFNGICASHTSATSMGTDWRNNDPVVEPMVEIYQGARQNYERPGAPRCPSKDDSIGGWEPKGFVNLALLKGYRFGFESSSDHGSTHISYACVYAKEASRQGIFDAMKLRHTYGATDDIIADVQSDASGKKYMMGDEFSSKEAPNLIVRLIGTKPFAKVTIVKDDVEVHVIEPHTKEVSFTWKDDKAESGKTSYYYVRGEQEDTELVWASPMWIKYEP